MKHVRGDLHPIYKTPRDTLRDTATPRQYRQRDMGAYRKLLI